MSLKPIHLGFFGFKTINMKGQTAQTKKELIQYIYENSEKITKGQIKILLDITLEGMKHLIDTEGQLIIAKFGVFTNVKVKGVYFRNPVTGVRSISPDRVRTEFKSRF